MSGVAMTGDVRVSVAAPVESVWRVVANMTRTGEWSHECHQVRWRGGAGRSVSRPQPLRLAAVEPDVRGARRGRAAGTGLADHTDLALRRQFRLAHPPGLDGRRDPDPAKLPGDQVPELVGVDRGPDGPRPPRPHGRADRRPAPARRDRRAFGRALAIAVDPAKV